MMVAICLLADVHPAQFPDDRPRKHHVYPGQRYRCMDSVPPGAGCHPTHQGRAEMDI